MAFRFSPVTGPTFTPPRPHLPAPPPPPKPPTPTPPPAPTPPPVTAPSVSDLQQMIANDPLFKQTQADIAASRAADQAQLSAERQRALIGFGAVPTVSSADAPLVGNLAPDITPTIQKLADENTAAGTSTTAQLDRAYQDNLAALRNSLAARGLLSSGETGYQAGRENDQYNLAQYNALQQLLDTLAGYQSTYLTDEGNLTGQLEQAASDAAGRVPVDTLAQTTTPTTPAAPTVAPPAPVHLTPAGIGGIPRQHFRVIPGLGILPTSLAVRG